MRHAVIVSHPDEQSFALSVARTYVEAASRHGHETLLRDLYRLGFNPLMLAEELPRGGPFTPAHDVQVERSLMAASDVFVFVYPLWFYTPPAMMKGYVERVFGMGFGYGPQHLGGNEPLLQGRRLVSISSSGAPEAWLQSEGALEDIRTLIDEHFAQVCGLTLVEHLHLGGITPGMRPDAVDRQLAKVRDLVVRRF